MRLAGNFYELETEQVIFVLSEYLVGETLEMNKTVFLGIIILIVLTKGNAQIYQGVGANTEDPKKILLAADQAVSRLRQTTYEASYQGTGAFAVRTGTISGKIKLFKLEAGNPLTAKIASQGDYYPAGKDQPEPFAATFTGKIVFSLRSNEKVLLRKILSDSDPKERDFGFVTQRLGVGTDQLIMYEFLLPKPFERQMAAEVLEYEGRATAGDVLCHVVYAEFDRRPDGRIRRQRWFIGIKDNLPRKVETIVVDDKGRYGAYELTLTNLRADVPISPQAFAVQLPKGYKIKDYEPPKRPELLAVGEVAPDWTLTDALGKTYSLSNYRGKIVILDFWATWCGPCVKAMPEIQALHDKFKDRGVEVFGINAWEESNSSAYFKDKGYTYNLLLNGETITKPYRVSNLPTIYVIGAKGEIIYRGITPDVGLAKVLEQNIKEN